MIAKNVVKRADPIEQTKIRYLGIIACKPEYDRLMKNENLFWHLAVIGSRGGAKPRVCQGKCPGRNTFARAADAVKSGNNEIIYQDILTALADATNGLSISCHE